MNDSKTVAFFGLDRQYQRYREEFKKITERVLETGKVLQGPDVKILEERLGSICRRKHAVALGSCTDALAFALLAAGIGPGDEVLVTSLSFFASVSCILRVGATPRFVDIEPDYFMMDTKIMGDLLTPGTKAVLGVHLYGQALPVSEMEEFVNRHNLTLIEDGAQSIGAYDNGRPVGNMGDVSCLSFDPTKVIGSFSSGGALLTDDDDLARKVRMLRYHGRDPDTRRYEMVGYNSQLSSEMAGMLVFKLSQIKQWEKERARVAGVYLDGLGDLPQVKLPQIRPGSTHVWHKFVMQVDDRDSLQAALKNDGIQSMVHYPGPLCDEPAIKLMNLPPEATNVPVTRQIAANVLSLPIYPDLTTDEAMLVVDRIKKFYSS